MKSHYPEGHPFYGFGPDAGLHVLRNKWVQRSYVEEQSTALAPAVDIAIEATRLAVPRRPARGKDFRIDPCTHGMRMRLDEIDETSQERRMEQRLYLVYGPGGDLGPTALWAQLIAFQVPLHDHQVRGGWGHIDLMALTQDGHPIVIELKKQDAQDTPLRAMIEGLANAVAVEENWPAMSREIRAMCSRIGLVAPVAEVASPVTTVILAPETYWSSWERSGRLGQAVDSSARDSFRGLRASLATTGFSTCLGTFNWPFGDDPGVRAAAVDW